MPRVVGLVSGKRTSISMPQGPQPATSILVLTVPACTAGCTVQIEQWIQRQRCPHSAPKHIHGVKALASVAAAQSATLLAAQPNSITSMPTGAPGSKQLTVTELPAALSRLASSYVNSVVQSLDRL